MDLRTQLVIAGLVGLAWGGGRWMSVRPVVDTAREVERMSLAALESRVARRPDDVVATRVLLRRYLDHGMTRLVVDTAQRAPERVQRDGDVTLSVARGLYTHWQRTFLHPSLLAFDAPSREECTANRVASNTPKAALAILNDPTFVEPARAMALRTLREGGGTDRDRLHGVWQSALTRKPDEPELVELQKLLEESQRIFRQDEEAVRKLLEVGQLRQPPEIAVPELAAWTFVCRAILNLHEFTTRN